MTPKDVLRFVTAQRRPTERCRERGADLRRRVGAVGVDHQAAPGRGLEPLWLPGHP